mgnify:CR=1 FL=1
MDSVLDGLEDPPDGEGWWPNRFAVDKAWAGARGTSFRAVMNYPTMQAKRVDATLSLRMEGTADVYNYQLSLMAEFPSYYKAERI